MCEKIIPNVDIEVGRLNHIVRENAHFFSYLVLGILVIIGLRSSEIKRYIGFALLICVLFAISDEIHQIYVPGRSGQINDVVIDSAGALSGIGMYMFKKN